MLIKIGHICIKFIGEMRRIQCDTVNKKLKTLNKKQNSIFKEAYIMQKIINQNLISYKTVVRTYNETISDNKEVLTRQKEIIITDVQTTQKNVFLPDEIDGCPISDISAFAFENNDSVEHITLPKQLKSIRRYAFRNCKNLKTIDIPASVNLIEDSSFINCTSLKEISLLNDVLVIFDKAFDGCTQLEKINMTGTSCCLNKDVFDNTAFYNNESNWESGILYVGHCLVTARGIMNTCKVKEGTTTIASFAFKNNIAMKDVTLPDSITYIGYLAFDGCASLNSITAPKGVFDYDTPLF